MAGYIFHVLVELWRPITFESITNLIVSIHYTVRLIDLSKNNYVTRLANNRFKSHGPPKFNKDIGYITDHYVISSFILVKVSANI